MEPIPPSLDTPVDPEAVWAEARAGLAGLPGGRGLNIAHETVDRHAQGAAGERIALRCLVPGAGAREIPYRELSALSSRFANLLRHLGVGTGEVVASLLGRVPELYLSALGTLKNRSLFCPLYSAFGPEPLRQRLGIGRVRVLVTTPELYRHKVAGLRQGLPGLRWVLLTGEGADLPDCLGLQEGLEGASDRFEIPPTDPQDWALLHFTSGTTGPPKAAVHAHEAVLMHRLSGRLVLDIHPEDVFWCTADPGWVTGTSYGILAPLALGATLIADPEPFDPERWYRLIQEQRVNVWYTAPTAVRMLMRVGEELPRRFDTSSLRRLASVGEPLNPEAVTWSERVFGLPFHDTWWQTETGAILIANWGEAPVRPGSMGRPLPGIEARLVRRGPQGRLDDVDANQPGELALRAGWPSMFRAYLGEPERYARAFVEGWYLSGDLVRRDAEGWFWFIGRADDLIKSSGHLIGPFEVESLLLAHPAVAEAGVIGKPDPVAGELVKAFVALKPGFNPNEALGRELLAHCRRRLGAVVAPKEIAFRASLPKTRSGKLLRRLLRAEELGLPRGDLSSLEPAPDETHHGSQEPVR